MLGIDAHKRTHTVVAVDLSVDRSGPRLRMRPRPLIIWRSFAGPTSSATTGAGPLRTAGICHGGSSATCLLLASGSFACHPS